MLGLMGQKPAVSPLRVAEAAGPLPEYMEYDFVVRDTEKNLFVFEMKQPIINQHCAPFLPEVSAVVERLFLTPSDARIPHAAMGLRGEPVSCISLLPTPCTACGGRLCSDLYFDCSPTWRGMFRDLDRILAGVNTNGRAYTFCTCKVCFACKAKIKKADIKQCSGCKSAWLCSNECMRRFWPHHKVDCRKEVARRAAQLQAQGLD